MKTLIKVTVFIIIIVLVPLSISLILSQIEVNPDKVIAMADVEKKVANVPSDKDRLSPMQILLLALLTLIVSIAYFIFFKKYVLRKKEQENSDE